MKSRHIGPTGSIVFTVASVPLWCIHRGMTVGYWHPSNTPAKWFRIRDGVGTGGKSTTLEFTKRTTHGQTLRAMKPPARSNME